MRKRNRAAAIAAAAGILALEGCADGKENLALAGLTALLVGAQAPTNEVEMIYYLGVFDPRDQVPPTIYRVRAHGQASFFSGTKFASGWVRAELIDSLSTGARFDGNSVVLDEGNSLAARKLETGRRLVALGPEGFRKAPRDHRLVIVMASDPSAFFNAMDQSLSVINEVDVSRQSDRLVNRLFVALGAMKSEGDRLSDLQKNLANAIPTAQ